MSMDLSSLEQNSVEHRLEKAQFYQQVLGTLSPQNGMSKVQEAVMTELQGFVRGRMRILMGMDAPETSGFTKEEVTVLKAVAERLRNPPSEPEPKFEEEVEAPTVVEKAPQPKVAQAAKVQPKPKSKPDPNALPMGLVATGKTMDVPFEVRGPGGNPVTKIKTYKEVTALDGSKGWYGTDGQVYIISEDPTTGAQFMKNITRQAQSNNHKRLPQVYGTRSVMLAAEQADRLTRGKSTNQILLEANQRMNGVEELGITLE